MIQFQTGGQISTSGTTILPQLSVGHIEPQTAVQRAQPAARNGVTLPRLSDHRRHGRKGAAGGTLPATKTARRKDCVIDQDKENNVKNITLDDVLLPLSPNGRQYAPDYCLKQLIQVT